MYELLVERANGETEHYEFKDYFEREDFIDDNWDDDADWLVPCGFGNSWIDVRDRR